MRTTKELKVILDDKVAPGPGTYRPPSDFGHYDDPPIHNPSLMVRTAHSKFRR